MNITLHTALPTLSDIANPPTGKAKTQPVSKKDLSLKFRAGSACLYLVETLGEWTGRRFERIPNGTVWQEWLNHLGLPLPDLLATEEDLAQMRQLRVAIFDVVQAVRQQKTPPTESLACINYWARRTPPPVALDNSATRLASQQGITQQQIFSFIARDAVALLSGPLRQRIRECASVSCPVLFVDKSRRGDRIWCSPTCGARLATARYRRRHTTP